jgi:hypothetical protein
VQRTVPRAVVALCGEKMINNREGCTQWVTKAARGTRTRVRIRRKENRNKRKKRSWINNRKRLRNWKQDSNT